MVAGAMVQEIIIDGILTADPQPRSDFSHREISQR